MHNLLKSVLICLITVFPIMGYSYQLKHEDITIISPKFVIGNNDKFQAQIKNVIINRFQDVFELELGQIENQKVLTEFFDYTCGHCKKMHETILQLYDQYPDLKVIYKEFPIKGDKARIAARAALASKEQNKHPEFHHELMVDENLSKNTIFEHAKLLKLNMKQFEEDLESKAIYQIISDNYGLAKALKITGTPTLLVLGKKSGKPHVYYIAGRLQREEFNDLF